MIGIIVGLLIVQAQAQRTNFGLEGYLCKIVKDNPEIRKTQIGDLKVLKTMSLPITRMTLEFRPIKFYSGAGTSKLEWTIIGQDGLMDVEVKTPREKF